MLKPNGDTGDALITLKRISQWAERMAAKRRIVSLLLNIAIAFSVIIVGISVLNDVNVALPVVGISMLPAIHTGDLAIVVPTSVSSLHVGDIVVYRFEGTLIIHRVIAVYDNANPPYVIVKGDNNPIPDQNITGPRQITNSLLVGKVVMLIEGMGIFTDTATKYLFSGALIILILLDYYLSSKPQAISDESHLDNI
ncbi:MAG: signal peptidase I [Conexivisphaerales archaeon]